VSGRACRGGDISAAHLEERHIGSRRRGGNARRPGRRIRATIEPRGMGRQGMDHGRPARDRLRLSEAYGYENAASTTMTADAIAPPKQRGCRMPAPVDPTPVPSLRVPYSEPTKVRREDGRRGAPLICPVPRAGFQIGRKQKRYSIGVVAFFGTGNRIPPPPFGEGWHFPENWI